MTKSQVGKRTITASELHRTATISAQVDVEALRSARKKMLDHEAKSMPFANWQESQKSKLQDDASFPTQFVWYA
jgi:hypothetical protein